MQQMFLSSITRISTLAREPFDISPWPREQWQQGDYIVGRVRDSRGNLSAVELPNGRMIEAMDGDLVVGALGTRVATLEAVGDWRAIDDSGEFNALTSAGLFGRTTSLSPFLATPMLLDYEGHACRDGVRVTMPGSLPAIDRAPYDGPVVLIVGTSMSAGKTTSGRVIVHQLARLGLKVVGAKLTGAARYRDMLSFADAGADAVFDFVDAGLPSSACDGEEYRRALGYLLARIAAEEPDVLVAEAGASPLEPYNGAIAMETISEQVKFKLLCAQDPYAVVGVRQAFDRQPDLVAGGATNTDAGIALVQKLSDLPALNLMRRESHEPLESLLRQALALP